MASIAPFTNSGVMLRRQEAEAFAELFADIRRQADAAFAIVTARLDMIDGDPDDEDNGDLELTGDERDVAWTEWHYRGRWMQAACEMPDTFNACEDAEDDDPDTEHDGAEPEDGQ